MSTSAERIRAQITVDEAVAQILKDLRGWTVASIVPVSIRIAGQPVAYRATLARRDDQDQPEIVVYGAGGSIGHALSSAARKAALFARQA